jgi:hypothetical protein
MGCVLGFRRLTSFGSLREPEAVVYWAQTLLQRGRVGSLMQWLL